MRNEGNPIFTQPSVCQPISPKHSDQLPLQAQKHPLSDEKLDQHKDQLKSKGKRWTLEQQEIYMNFLLQNPQLFADQRTRRRKKVFEQLSIIFKRNRTSEQCRTHHQKMRRKVNGENIDDIAKALLERKLKKERKKLNKNGSKMIIGSNYIKNKANVRLFRNQKKKSLRVTIDFNDNVQFYCW